MRVLKWVVGVFIVVFVGFAVSWLVFMPNSAERGVWVHEANGRVLSLGYFRANIYHQTAAGCVPTMSFPAHMALVKAIESAWIEVENDQLALHIDGYLAPAIYARADTLPEACNNPIKDTPALTFGAMWATMNEHYPFFELHGVNWNERRALAPENTATDTELYEAIKTALTGLDDGHLQLITDEHGYFSPRFAPEWMPEPALKRSALTQIARDNIGITLTPIENTGLEYGIREDGIGYLLITRMSTQPGFNQLSTSLARESFARVAAALADADAIIIDVRYNPGGDDATAFAFAGHLTDTPVLALRKRTRMGGGWTEAIEATVQPLTPRLDQPIILLTSDLTSSAAEIFTMALREMPQVIVMGENTGGRLSDILDTTLPNGWHFGLSNQDYRTPDGSAFEGRGLPPDIRIETDAQALVQGADVVLEAAIAHALKF
ncbi:MAG: peptidase S41 [Rhodobacteraceae bacterium]|nr:peptidase S41 [Paracoccaceae bacterium]